MTTPLPTTLAIAALAASLVATAPAARADEPSFPPAPGPEVQNALPDYHVADPSAPPVTAATLLANERFWPYHVTLVEPVAVPGAARALPASLRGVLIRANADGSVRVDFGRDGMLDVPLAATDVVAGANRTREGEELKIGPNLGHAIGPRLVDAKFEKVHAVVFSRAREYRGFLTVFADLADEQLAAIARATAPLHEHGGLAVVVFPQGDVADAVATRKLRELGWPVLSALDRLSEMYTRTLVAGQPRLPYVMLQTNEGRVLYEASWGPGVGEALVAAAHEHFPATAVAAGGEPAPAPQ
ncbi:MAG: hypothetical protein R3E88_14045 [Myxococcota bacterium]